MPMKRDRYPLDWDAISRRVRERDGNKCRFCGVENGSYVLYRRDGTRESVDPEGYDADEPLERGERITRIVLTVAHLGAPHADGRLGNKHDKMDVRDENLAALCQRCHLHFDRDEHVGNAAKTRRQKRVERGQLELVAEQVHQ